MKKKKVVGGVIAVTLAVATVVTGVGSNWEKGVRAEAKSDEEATVVAVRSLSDFRKYIDYGNEYSCQDVIETDWEGNTDVYSVKIPSDGKLYIYCLSENGWVKGHLYSNYELTMSAGVSQGCASSRSYSDNADSITVDVEEGTYYYRAERWNGTDPLTVTTYLGFCPDDSDTVTDYFVPDGEKETEYNLKPVEVNSPDEVIQSVKDSKPYASQDTITDRDGVSDPVSINVEESGWLIIYPLCEKTWIKFQLYTESGLNSRIFRDYCVTGGEEAYTCYLDAGTYYYRGYHWNGSDPLTFTTYLGFISDSSKLKVVSTEVSDDKTTASVTFNDFDGTVRVMRGEHDPVLVNDDKFWETDTRTNVLKSNVAEITENGTYLARLEDESGLNSMVEFTVSGLNEKPQQTAEPSPMPTIKPTTSPTIKPTVKPTTKPTVEPDEDDDDAEIDEDKWTSGSASKYKVKAKKSTIIVKKKKTAKIRYSVTKGYSGKVSFSSSNKKIATVTSAGLVKGKKTGKCRITIKLNNGSTAKVTIKVR